MWLNLLGIALGLLAKWFGAGQPDRVAQGVTSGIAQEKAASDDRVIDDIAKANDAARDVPADPSKLRDSPTGFFRD